MTSTPTFTRINAQNVASFKSVLASAKSDMDVDEINHLIVSLVEIKEVKAAANSDKARRIERMNAARLDPAMSDIRRTVNAQLERLGFAGGVDNNRITLKNLSEAMAADGMSETARFTLKDGCFACGVI